jgi:hypothetical protein
MDWTSFILVILTVLFIGAMVAMNTMISVTNKPTVSKKEEKEGFEVSSVAVQIRSVLDPMLAGTEDLCPLFTTIRENMGKNEKAGQDISDAEVSKRVEKALALKIPGGALPCPLLQYPREGSSDLEWLNFLQTLPSDFGARIVFMSLYARDFLKQTEQSMKDALAGKGSSMGTDGFANICPPDVAQTRRLEKQKQLEAGCVLPEDMGSDKIKEEVTKLLETLVAKKTSVLKAKDIDPLINVKPILDEAKQSQAYLQKQASAAESGTLQVNLPPA